MFVCEKYKIFTLVIQVLKPLASNAIIYAKILTCTLALHQCLMHLSPALNFAPEILSLLSTQVVSLCNKEIVLQSLLGFFPLAYLTVAKL